MALPMLLTISTLVQFSYGIIIPVKIIKKNCNANFKTGGTCSVPVRNWIPLITLKVDDTYEIEAVLDTGSDTSYLVSKDVYCLNKSGIAQDCRAVFDSNVLPIYEPAGVPIDPLSPGFFDFFLEFGPTTLWGCLFNTTIAINGMNLTYSFPIGIIFEIDVGDREQLGLLGIGSHFLHPNNFPSVYYGDLMTNRGEALMSFGVKCEPNYWNIRGVFSLREKIASETDQLTTTAKLDVSLPYWAFSVERVEFIIDTETIALDQVDRVVLDTGNPTSFMAPSYLNPIIKQAFNYNRLRPTQIREYREQNQMIFKWKRNDIININPHFKVILNDTVEQRQKEIIIPKETILRVSEQEDDNSTLSMDIYYEEHKLNELTFGLGFFQIFYAEIIFEDVDNALLKLHRKSDCEEFV